MKKLKKGLCLFIALVFIIPTILLLSACGDKSVDVFGKTFSYQGTNEYNWDSFSPNGTPIETLLQKEFNKNNLDLKNTIVDDENIGTIDLSGANSFESLISLIITNLNSVVTAKLSNYTIVVGTEEEKTITINGTTHTFEVDPRNPQSFNIYNSKNELVGSFSKTCSKINNKNIMYFNLYTMIVEAIISIPTKTIITDPSAVKDMIYDETTQTNIVTGTKINVVATPRYTEVTE